jgi:amino acid permease
MATLTGDSLKRQTDINEWYYKYRLDTLFVLQMLFLGMSLLVLLSVLASYRIVSPFFVGYYAVLMLIGVFIVWYFKYKYNNESRDFAHWDKRRFPSDGKMSSNVSAEVRQALTQIAAEKCTN